MTLVRDVAVQVRTPKSKPGVSDPPETWESDTRYHYSGAFSGTSIAWEQLASGKWVVTMPQTAGDDYISLGGAGDLWHAKAMAIWYCPVVLKAEPSPQYNIILSKHPSANCGFHCLSTADPNLIYYNVEDSVGGNTLVTYTITNYVAWYYLFGYFTSARKVRLIVNGVPVGTSAGILTDNHGQGTNFTGSPIRIGGGVANRYDKCEAADPQIWIGDENTGDDAYWDAKAISMYNSQCRDYWRMPI